jgi:hypothetical protein
MSCANEKEKGRRKKKKGHIQVITFVWAYLGGGIVQHGRDDALLEGGQRLGDLFLGGWGRKARRGGET